MSAVGRLQILIESATSSPPYHCCERELRAPVGQPKALSQKLLGSAKRPSPGARPEGAATEGYKAFLAAEGGFSGQALRPALGANWA